jgi:DNA mismatch endonuclease (patch repair protein)
MMSGIRGKNTKPEMVVRQYLHRHGLRYRLHDRSLAGHPDIVLPKYHTIVFVHGCFWHKHSCSRFVWPKTRREFWEEKITGNVLRDQRNEYFLKVQGWNVIVVWECEISDFRLQMLVNEIKQQYNMMDIQ